MTAIPAIGVLSWLVAGVLASLAARWLPPRPPTPGWPATLALGAIGALAAGFLAAALGFGGTASIDPPALLVAFLTGALAVVVARLARRR